eukprot:scaffold192929_cov40-Tisochrysis_lutea.AAC.2
MRRGEGATGLSLSRSLLSLSHLPHPTSYADPSILVLFTFTSLVVLVFYVLLRFCCEESATIDGRWRRSLVSFRPPWRLTVMVSGRYLVTSWSDRAGVAPLVYNLYS